MDLGTRSAACLDTGDESPRVCVPAIDCFCGSRRNLIGVLNEPMDHAPLAPFDDADTRLPEGVRQNVTLVLQRIMVRGDDHDRRQPSEIGKYRADDRVIRAIGARAPGGSRRRQPVRW